MTVELKSEHCTAAAAGLVATASSRDDEAALVVDARNGSAVAVRQLIGRYESRSFRLARKITSNHEDAEEVVQNAFAKAFQSYPRFAENPAFTRGWSVSR